MLYLLYGPPARLLAHCHRHFADAPQNLQHFPDPHFTRPGSIVRDLLPQIRERRGDDFTDSVVEDHRIAASLMLSRVHDDLTPDERGERSRLIARLDSNMTHNEIAQQALYDALADFLAALVEGESFCLVIPDMRRLDACSLGILRVLFQRHPQALDLVLGYERSRPKTAYDENGILWEYGPDLLTDVATGLARVSPTVEVDLTAVDGLDDDELDDAAPSVAPAPADPLDDDLERRVFQQLAATAGPPSAQLRAEATEAVSRAFAIQSFRETLLLARALLRHDPELDPEQTAVVHATLALAAHNRQFRSMGNLALAEFLAEHTERALEGAAAPALEVCLHYRAAVTLARRLDRFAEGDRSVDQAFAVLESSELSASRKALLEVWLRNIRAYIYFRLGRNAEAAQESETTYQLLDHLLATLPEDDLLWTEAQLTLAVLADNLVRLSFGRDLESYVTWLRRTDRALDPWPNFKRLTAREWANMQREAFDLESALLSSRRGLRLARTQIDPLMELANLANLADLHDRAGDAATALALFREARGLRDQIEAVLDAPLALELGEAAAAARLGRHDHAEASLRRLLPADESAEPASAARLWARLGLLAARAGQAEAAEERMNRAIDLAVDTGARDLLVEVATASGEASRALGRSDDAREAFEKAWEIAEPGGLEALHPPVGVMLFRGLHATSGDPAHLLTALRLLPDALVLDADTWWILAAFLEELSATLDLEGLDAETRDALERAKTAATQRPDARQALEALDGAPVKVAVAG